MLKLLTAAQAKEVDAYTILKEPILAVDLMERASKAFVSFFINHFPDRNLTIAVYAGTGNNGGDGLAIARMLHQHGYRSLSVKIARFSRHISNEFEHNRQLLLHNGVKVVEIIASSNFPEEQAAILIDALLGSGLNKPLSAEFARLVAYLNDLKKTIVAVDVPAGFFTEGILDQEALVLKANLVITFQFPAINFLLPESASYMDSWEVVPIGLNEPFLRSLDSPYFWIEEMDIRQMIKRRLPFQHKGSFGHVLVIAGQERTMGAALLTAAASTYAGSGLTTACIPEKGTTALHTYMPEIMLIQRTANVVPEIDWQKYQVIAIGPGLGIGPDAEALLSEVLHQFKQPLVLDADALNVLAVKPELWELLPINSVITPHVKEFDRLFGTHASWWSRLETIRHKALEKRIFIILKNRYSILATPEGHIYFNPTGNPAMATGGMGDVLTGIIASFLAQGYPSKEACHLALFVHGKAGDELALPHRLSTVLPSQLTAQLPLTIGKLQS